MNTLDRLKDSNTKLYRLIIDIGEHIPNDAEYTELFNLWDKLLDAQAWFDNELFNLSQEWRDDGKGNP